MSKVLDMLKEAVELLEEKEKSKKVELSTLKPGEVFKAGEHDFLVLEQGHDGVTAVISKNLMKENVVFDSDGTDYTKSCLRNIIDTEIYPLFEEAFGEDNLVPHRVDLTTVDMQEPFSNYFCKVRPLTFDEARKYNKLLVNKELPDWYWTCTPLSTKERGWGSSLVVVAPAGDIGRSCFNYSCGVRPFCILKSNIFVSKVD